MHKFNITRGEKWSATFEKNWWKEKRQQEEGFALFCTYRIASHIDRRQAGGLDCTALSFGFGDWSIYAFQFRFRFLLLFSHEFNEERLFDELNWIGSDWIPRRWKCKWFAMIAESIVGLLSLICLLSCRVVCIDYMLFSFLNGMANVEWEFEVDGMGATLW